MRTFPGVLFAAFCVAMMMAGCTSSSGASPQSTVEASAPPAQHDDTTGGIEGVVTDEELQVVPGAMVGLIDVPTAQATTDDAGKFSLSNVAPGTHTLAAQKLGYDSAAKKVIVNATEVSSGIRIVLSKLAVKTPYPEPLINKGIIMNGVGLIATATCSNCGSAENKYDFNKKYIPKDYSGVLIESQWRTTDFLGLDVVDRAVSSGIYWRIRAHSPIHDFIQKCGNYLDPPHYASKQMLCTDEEIAANKMNLETWYVGEYQTETHNLDPACKNNPVLGYKAGCYGVGYAPEIVYTNYVTIFHGELPPDAANMTFAPDG